MENNKKLLKDCIDLYSYINNLSSAVTKKSFIDHALGRSIEKDVENYIQTQKTQIKSIIDYIIGGDSELIVHQTSFNANARDIFEKLEKHVN